MFPFSISHFVILKETRTKMSSALQFLEKLMDAFKLSFIVEKFTNLTKV